MELTLKTKYVLGLPGGTQIGLERGKNNLRTMTMGGLTAVKDSMVFLKPSLRPK